MPTMGGYCKAYAVTELREFDGWSENTGNTRKIVETVNGQEVEQPRILTDEDYLFLQENLTVTDGIFLDENIIYDNITPEWEQFCKQRLKFEIPSDLADAAAGFAQAAPPVE